MENHQTGDVLNSPSAPFEHSLAAACATAAHYSSVGSPSLPNYLAVTSGQTYGIQDDAGPRSHPIDADNIFRQVRAAGGSARSYIESMPAACAQDSTGRYAVKHNPAAYYQGSDDRAACQRDDLPLGTHTVGPFAADLSTGTLGAYTLVIPDLCNDTHDCPVSVGDAWLHQWIDVITASPVYRAGTTALFVVWDEPTPMPFIAVAPAIQPGTTIRDPVDHDALLRTTEELLGLPLLGQARTAISMRPLLQI
jgi:phospholipase C